MVADRTQPRTVQLERERDVAILRLDRPPVNAVELSLGREADAALDEALAGGARAIVVTGAGGCFSAGLDLKIVPLYGPDEQRALVAAANRLLGKLYACPLPVVAAINGHAIAAGLVLALACDYRVGPRAPAKLGLTEARAGIPFPAAAMAIVQAELAPPAARVLTLLARTVDAEQALALGALDELRPTGEVLPRALEVANDLAGISPDAYRRIKRQLRAETIARIERAVSGGTDPMLAAWLGAETAAASRAVLEHGGNG
jgi:enoyl-CoA hydratase